jgi:Ca2+-binding EF-hand superfamily protein
VNKFTQKSENNFYYSNLFKKKYEKLSNPLDSDPLTKIKRIVCSSKYNLDKFFEIAALECRNNDFIVNKFQFKNIIKKLNIGITNLEIDQILAQSGKLDYNNMINLRDFVKYLYSQNNTLEEGQKNVGKIIGKIKSLIYKYYSNPIICFHNNDKSNEGKMDFDKFKILIFDMYSKEEIKIPPFTLIKNAFDEIDLRKDGILDLNEWCKTFGNYNSLLDPDEDKISNGEGFFGKKFRKKNNFRSRDKIENNRKILREWETSGDVSAIYKYLYKNRKEIKQMIVDRKYLIKINEEDFVHYSNFIDIIRDILPNLKLSQTQWKIIVNIAQTERADNLINIKDFFKLVEFSSKNMTSHPFIK